MIGTLQAHLTLALLLKLAPPVLGRLVSVDFQSLHFGGFSFAGAAEPAGAALAFIAPEEVAASDCVIDLRSLTEAPVSPFPGALRIEADALADPPREFPPGARIVLCCRSGLRAWRAARTLQAPGTRQRGAGRARGVNTVLVIAGTDSSGGAGLARDLRTLTELDTRAVCAVTAVTAQSDAGVLGIHVVPPAMVRDQIEAAFATCRIDAVKIGMLATAATVQAVSQGLRAHPAVPVVLDPVLAASSGAALLDGPGREALLETLLPQVTC